MNTRKRFICPALLISSLCVGCMPEKKEDVAFGPRIASSTHYAAGRMLEGQKNYLGAISQYRKVIDVKPQSPRAYNRIAIIYQRLHRSDAAQQILKEGIEANPESAVLRNNFGFCCLRNENFAGAEQQFRKALELSPRFPRARMNLGILLAKTNHLSKSAAEFKHVVSEDAAYYNVATICINEKKYADAEWALRNALAYNSNFGPAISSLKLVTALARSSADDVGKQMDGIQQPVASNIQK